MGMYSYFEYEDLHTKYPIALRNWIKEIHSRDRTGWHDYLEDIKIFDNGVVSLECWDGYKIISYWYPEFVKVLRYLALFLEGEIEFIFETHNEKATIRFKDYKFSVDIGTMQYESLDMKAMFKLHNEKVPTIERKLKDILMVESL